MSNLTILEAFNQSLSATKKYVDNRIDGLASETYVNNAVAGFASKADPSFTGNVTVAGKVTVGTAPTENMDVGNKQYVDNVVAAANYGPYSIRYNSENNRLEFIYTPTN